LNKEIKKISDENQQTLQLNMPGVFAKGILIYGLNFPPDKLTFPIDLQLHYSASMSMFFKAHTDELNIPIYNIDDYNDVKQIVSNNKINKYFNIKSVIGTEINDGTFEKIIDFLEWKIYGKDYNILSTKGRKELNSTTNEKAISILDISKNNQIINDQKEIDSIDASLSITADLYDQDDRYDTKKKETSKYINKVIEDSLTESDMSTEWDDFTDINNINDMNDIEDQDGGKIKFSELTYSDIDEMIKMI